MRRALTVLGQLVAAFVGVSGFRVCPEHRRGCPPGPHARLVS